MAAPHIVTAVLAAAGSRLPLPGPAASLPLAALFIVGVQLSGVLLARESELPAWWRVWLSALATTVVLLPALALQAAASRVPFVSLARGSAGVLLWTTAGSVLVLIGLAVLAIALGSIAPDQASLLFVPAAVLVPAVVAAPGNLDQASALAALAEASALSAIAVCLGWLARAGARPLVGPVALAAQFVCLWFLGYAPVFAPGQGTIVPVLASVLLVVTVVLTVLVPVGALLVRRIIEAVRSEQTDPAPRSRSRVPPGRS